VDYMATSYALGNWIHIRVWIAITLEGCVQSTQDIPRITSKSAVLRWIATLISQECCLDPYNVKTAKANRWRTRFYGQRFRSFCLTKVHFASIFFVKFSCFSYRLESDTFFDTIPSPVSTGGIRNLQWPTIPVLAATFIVLAVPSRKKHPYAAERRSGGLIKHG